MSDVVTKAVRSRIMSSIRNKNTRIELTIRKRLWARGFRYRLNDLKLPGKPDIVLPRYHALIFIHGCFWHGHDCPLFRIPKTRTAFWKEKINTNKRNDTKHLSTLEKLPWKVMIVWECALRGKTEKEIDNLVEKIARWLRKPTCNVELRG